MKYKNFVYIIIMILSFQIVLLAQKPLVVSDLKINCQNIMAEQKVNNDIYFLGSVANQTGKYQFMTLSKYSNGKITEIPLEIEINGKFERFKIYARDKMSYDSKGNIYLLGDGIYKYDGSNWSVYRINDEFEKFRKYSNITISKDDKIWFITQVREEIGEFKMVGEYHTKLYRKADDKLDVVYEEKWGDLVFDKIFALENGKVLIQKIYNKSNPFDVKKYNFDSTLYDLWVYDEKLNLEYDRINTPSGEPFNNLNKSIMTLTSNQNGDLFITLNSKLYDVKLLATNYRSCCGGYTEKIDNKWQKYDTTYNFKFIENAYNSFSSHYNFSDSRVLLLKLTESDYRNKFFDKNEKTVKDVISREHYQNSYVITVKDWENMDMLNEDLDLFCHNIIELDGNLWFINKHFISIIPKSNFDFLMSNEDITNDNILIIYPNPVKDVLNINIKIEPKNIEIIDLLGISYNISSTDKTINIENLNNGVYQIIVTDIYNNIHVSKFIKN